MIKKYLSISSIAICTLLVYCSIALAKSNIYIVATGGTIAGANTSTTEQTEYKAGTVLIQKLLSALPQDLNKIVNLKAEQLFSIGSQDMKPEYWLTLAKRINALLAQKEVDGIVITHGTDTLEETALFLNLTVKSTKPVVLVGAMRSSTSLSADGSKNLYDAIIVAANSASANRGVLTVMNDSIMSASDVTKNSTTSVESFSGTSALHIGKVWGTKVYYQNAVQATHTTQSIFSVDSLKSLPNVEILYGYAGSTGKAVEAAVANGAKGIVYAGVGNGNLSMSVEKALAAAVKKGVAVVRSSRVPTGATTQWNEVNDAKYGFITSWWNNPQQARVILMLGLTKTRKIKELQQMMLEY